MVREEARLMLLDVLASMELISESDKAAAAEGKAGDIEFGELGIDSLAVVDLCSGVEKRIGRELRVEEIVDNPTVNQLAAHLPSAS